MIKHFKPLIFISAFFVLALSSCRKELMLNIPDNNSISHNEIKSLVSQVKVWHDSTVSSIIKLNSQGGVKAFSVNENDIIPPVIEWEKAFINFDSSDIKSITIPISMNNRNGEHMQLVVTKSKNKLNGYFIKIIPDSSYFSKQIDLYNYFNFYGSITIYSLLGNRLKKQDFISGNASNSNNNSKVGLGLPGLDGTFADGLTATVKSRKRRIFSAETYGLIYIDYQQNIELDESYGGGGVIVGDENKNPKIPCNGDILAVPTIAASSKFNKNGGRFGLTRENKTKMHYGIDLKAIPNTPVFAGFAGRVLTVKKDLPSDYYKNNSFGNYVVIETVLPDGKIVEIKYAHLNRVDLKFNDIVQADYQIGLSGKTGNAQYISSPHVHLEMKDKTTGVRLDPEKYLATKFDDNGNSTGRPCN
jgi:murein DD-endopeptidase MepM/ murein hydrolase activator NlpD